MSWAKLAEDRTDILREELNKLVGYMNELPRDVEKISSCISGLQGDAGFIKDCLHRINI